MSTSPEKISSPPSGVGQRRFRGLAPEERQSQRRAQLMEAGLQVFGTRGFQAAGVRDICAEAKLTERYFYESFQNREALFLAVYEAAAASVERAMIEALMSAAGASSEDATRMGLRTVLGAFREDPRVARIMLIEALTLGTLDKAFAVSQSFATAIEALAATLYPELPEHGFDNRLLANGLYGSTVYIAQRWTLDGFKEPLEQILDHCAVFYEVLALRMGAPASSAAAPAPHKRDKRGTRKSSKAPPRRGRRV